MTSDDPFHIGHQGTLVTQTSRKNQVLGGLVEAEGKVLAS